MKYFKLYLVLGLLQSLPHKQKGSLIIPFTTAVHPAQGRVSEVATDGYLYPLKMDLPKEILAMSLLRNYFNSFVEV